MRPVKRGLEQSAIDGAVPQQACKQSKQLDKSVPVP